MITFRRFFVQRDNVHKILPRIVRSRAILRIAMFFISLTFVSAQPYYFFNGFPDAAQPNSWYNNSAGLGIGETAFIAGQTYIIETGRTAVINSTWTLPNVNIIVRPGALLVINSDVNAGTATIDIQSGGILRIHNNPNINLGFTGASFNNATLYYTGNVLRNGGTPELTANTNLAVNIIHDNSAGVEINSYAGTTTINGNVSVSSGTLRIIDAGNFVLAGTTTIARGALDIKSFGSSLVTCTGEFILGNGTECILSGTGVPKINLQTNVTLGGGNFRTEGFGQLEFSGTGSVTGRMSFVQTSVSVPVMNQINLNRSNTGFSLGTNVEVNGGIANAFNIVALSSLSTNNFLLRLNATNQAIDGTLNVSSQGTLEINNSVPTGAGSINVAANARLRTFDALNNNVNYTDASSILEYFGTNNIWQNLELPNLMFGSVEITNTNRVELFNTTIINGNLTIAPATPTNLAVLELRNAVNLTLNGKITTQGNTPTLGVQEITGVNNLTLGGTDTTTIRNFSIDKSTVAPLAPNVNPYLLSFTMNRPARLELSRDLVIDANAGAALKLVRGIIVPPQTATGRVIVLSPSSTAIEGGSPSSYIQGPLQRSLSVASVSYPYPIGTATEYMPMSIISPPSVTPSPSVVVTPSVNALGGFVMPPVFSFKDNRRQWRMQLGSITSIGSFHIQVADTDLVASNVVLTSSVDGGNFASLGGILTGTSLLRTSTIFGGIGNMSDQVFVRIGNTTPPPTITRVSPLVIGSGANISIEGTNFINVSRVQFSTTTMPNYTVQSPTLITGVAPATIATANPNDNAIRVPLIVRAQGGTTASVDTIIYVLQPAIQSFSPSIGGRGTALTIRGFRFSGTYSTTPTVTIGGIPVQSVTVVANGELRVIVPQNATTGVIRVTTPGGSVVSSSIFTFVPPPRITAIIPNIAREGDRITILGTGFDMVSAVLLGGIGARNFTVNSTTQITAVVGSGSTGTVTVRAVGGVIESTEEFLFAPQPTITNVLPRTVGTTGSFELQGAGFVGVREVRFTSASVNITSQNVQVLSRTRMIVDAPRVNFFGEVALRLTTVGGEATTNQTLTLVRSPEIFAFSPNSGTTGTLVQIFGANFLASTISNVRVAGVTVGSFEVVSDSLIVTRVNRITTGGNVSVTALGGTTIARTNFVNIAPAPVVSRIEPAFAIEGNVVTIWGENFNDANILRITNAVSRINLTEFRVVTNGQITFVVPRNATTGTLEVRTSGGTGLSPTIFTFLPPPVVSVLEPPFGIVGSGVLLQGENLRGVQEIRIGDAAATNIRLDSPNQLSFTLGSTSRLGFNQTLTIVSTQGTTVVPNVFSVVTEQDLDSLALVSIYQRTGGTAWTRREKWLTLFPISEWQGVTVDSASRRVVRLSLSGNNMVGSFPLGLQYMSRLRFLDWQNNRLTGRIPAFIATLRQLDTLRLGQNRFAPSVLPDSLGNLTNLRVLNLSGDSLIGSIPRSLAQATSLAELDLSNNQLVDSVPTFLASLQSLRILRLNNNRLIGSIPSSFGTTPTVFAKFFNASVNATPNLEELNLSDNQLTGSIPTNLSSLPLQTLALANNRLEGTISAAFIQRLTTVATLNLGGNNLSGVIPSEFGRLKNLRFLSLRRNQFAGTVPDSLASAENLETLWLDNNLLAGALPSTFERMIRLQRLDVSNNRLTSVPRLARVRVLNYVNLANNRMDFGSLEDVAPIDTIIIAPQDSIGDRRTITGVESLPLRLSVNTGGTSNRYQWFLETPNGSVPVSPILRDSIFQFIYTQASSGTYSCRVTNVLPEMRSLTLQSRPVTVVYGGLPPPPTQIPQPVSPFDGASFVSTNANVVWTFTTDASVYDVQISTQPNFMPILAQRAVSDTLTRFSALPFEQLLYWRVRGRNIAGATGFSETFSFTTAPRNIDILATSVRFSATPVADTSRSVLILTNTSTATLVVQSLTINDGENSFRLPDDVRGLTLRPNAEQRLDIEFTPRTVGLKRGTIAIQYSAQGVGAIVREQNYPNLVTGQAIPLKVLDVDFDTVRVNRTTLTTMIIENKLPRSPQNVVTIRAIRPVFNSRDNAFALRSFVPPVAVYPGDLTGVIFQCSPTLVGRPIGQYRVVYEYSQNGITTVDSTNLRVNVRAVATATNRDSLFLEFGIKPSLDTVAPGGRVDVIISIKDDSTNSSTLASSVARRRRVYQALGPRFLDGFIRYNPNVLSLIPNPYFEEVTNATQANDFQRVRVYVPRSIWSSAEQVTVATIPFRVVSGNTNVTPLIIEELAFVRSFGEKVIARNTTGLVKLYFDEPIGVTTASQGKFVAGVCEAGGLRLTTTARAVALTAVRPNPIKDVAELTYAVREDGLVVLELIDMQGKTLQTLVQGDHTPGEYLLTMDTHNLPSGTYFLRLLTPTSLKTQKIHVVK